MNEIWNVNLQVVRWNNEHSFWQTCNQWGLLRIWRNSI